jgi:hypothetical protein
MLVNLKEPQSLGKQKIDRSCYFVLQLELLE